MLRPVECRGSRRPQIPLHSPCAGSPNLNGRCERFIETIKLECLAKFIIFGRRHFDYLISNFVSYYNHHRAHMERDNLPPIREVPTEVETLSLDQVVVKSHVGGLVKSFERKVA
jgi:hypothetical protein